MTKRKRVYSGWMSKDGFSCIGFGVSDTSTYGLLELPQIYPDRGEKEDWMEEDYPPVKVRITIEELPTRGGKEKG